MRSARSNPPLAFFLGLLLFSLAGIPPLALPGFELKSERHFYYLIWAIALGYIGLRSMLGHGTETARDVLVTVEEAPSMLKTDDVALGGSIQNNVYDSLPLAMNASARDPSVRRREAT